MKQFRIDWNTIPAKQMSFDELNKFLDTHKLTRIRQNKENAYIKCFEDIRNRYFVVNDWQPYVVICGYTSSLGFFRLTTHGNIQEVKEAGLDGGPAMEAIDNDFKRIYKKSMAAAFRAVKYGDTARLIKACVPSPINYATDFWKEQRLYDIQKADVSSAYPCEMSKSLPTLEDHKRINGRVEPNNDYPFAFYIKSQHVKIIEEDGTVISTFDLEKSKEYMVSKTKKSNNTYINKFNNIPAEEDITILCKRAAYSFKPIMEYYYNNRKENPQFKQYMNLAIGMLHKNKNPKYSHLAAVVLLRCSWHMVKRIDELKKLNCEPLLVNTDSIAWMGDDISITTTTKSLGAFVLEHRNCEMIICSPKKYQWKDGDKVETTWAGIKDIKKMNLEYGKILDPIINKQLTPIGYRWDDEKSRYVIGGVII
jgi:hypothetical protein